MGRGGGLHVDTLETIKQQTKQGRVTSGAYECVILTTIPSSHSVKPTWLGK